MFDNTKKQITTNRIGNSKEHKYNKMSAFSSGSEKKFEKKATAISNGKTILQSEKGIGFQKNQNNYISKTNNNLSSKENGNKNNKNIIKQETIHSSVVTNKEQNIAIPENVPNQHIKQNNNLHFEFSGNKSNDLINCVLTAIHSWKNHYNLSIPDNVLMDQILTLFNQLREINR